VTNTIQVEIQNQIRNQYKVKAIQIDEYNTDQIQKQIYKQILECSTSSTKTNCSTRSTLGRNSTKLSSKAVPTLSQRCRHFQKTYGKLRQGSGKAAQAKLLKTQARLPKAPPLSTENSTENCRPKLPQTFHKPRKLQHITNSS